MESSAMLAAVVVDQDARVGKLLHAVGIEQLQVGVYATEVPYGIVDLT